MPSRKLSPAVLARVGNDGCGGRRMCLARAFVCARAGDTDPLRSGVWERLAPREQARVIERVAFDGHTGSPEAYLFEDR